MDGCSIDPTVASPDAGLFDDSLGRIGRSDSSWSGRDGRDWVARVKFDRWQDPTLHHSSRSRRRLGSRTRSRCADITGDSNMGEFCHDVS